MESIPNEFLESQVVTAAMIADKQANTGGGGNAMVHAPTTVTNTNSAVINPGSTAHSPAAPSGMGVMGVGSRG